MSDRETNERERFPEQAYYRRAAIIGGTLAGVATLYLLGELVLAIVHPTEWWMGPQAWFRIAAVASQAAAVGFLIRLYVRWELRAATAHQELRALEATNERLAAGRLATQRRTAYTLHEVVAQDLAACRALLSIFDDREVDELLEQETIRRVANLLEQSVRDLRRAALDLSPSLSDDLDLPSAVDSAIERVRRECGVKTHATLDPSWSSLSRGSQIELRQCLLDIVTHAAAIKEVTLIDLTMARLNGNVVTRIAYDGCDAQDSPLGRGYLHEGKGTISCEQSESATLIEIVLPLPASGADCSNA